MRENGYPRKAKREEKVQHKNQKDGLFLSRLVAFLFDSAYQIITWVCIGACFLSASIFFGKDNMRGVFWSGVFLAVFVLLMLALLADRYFFQSAAHGDENRPRVSVVSEVWIHELRHSKPSFFFVYEYEKRVIRSPIHDLIYVRLTNIGQLPFMIDYLGVEISNDGKTWVPAFLLDVFYNTAAKVAETPPGSLLPKLSYAKETLTDVIQYEPAKPRLRDVVGDRNIGPGETVKGWLFIERPAGFDSKGMYRLKVRNLNGTESFGVISQMKHREGTLAGISLTVIANHVDLTKIPLCYYSERDKLPER